MMTERFPRPLLYVIKERNEPFPDNRQRESADGKLGVMVFCCLRMWDDTVDVSSAEVRIIWQIIQSSMIARRPVFFFYMKLWKKKQQTPNSWKEAIHVCWKDHFPCALCGTLGPSRSAEADPSAPFAPIGPHWDAPATGVSLGITLRRAGRTAGPRPAGPSAADLRWSESNSGISDVRPIGCGFGDGLYFLFGLNESTLKTTQ